MGIYKLPTGLEASSYKLVSNCPGKVIANIKNVFYQHVSELTTRTGHEVAGLEFVLDYEPAKKQDPLKLVVDELGRRVDYIQSKKAKGLELTSDEIFTLLEIGPSITSK